MLVFTCMFAQRATLVRKMDISCTTTHKIAYQSVDVPSSVSISRFTSVWCWLSWTYISRLQNWAQGRGVSENTSPDSESLISEPGATSSPQGGSGGIPGRDVIRSAVGCLSWPGGGEWGPLHHHHLCEFFVVPFWQGRQPPIWFRWSIAGCLSNAAFNFLFAQNRTHPRVLFPYFSVWFFDQGLGFLYCGTQKAPIHYFGHIQGKGHVGLF